MSCTEIDPQFLLPDEAWERVKHVIPAERPKPKGGRPRMENRQALNAILLFAWVKRPNTPLSLGQTNFFLEFDVCFYVPKWSLKLN